MNEIGQIQFSIASADEIRNMSVVKVVFNDMYERGYPKSGGLCDLRMGTSDRGYKCQTCNGDISTCPGHFGHIELCTPIFHLGYIKTVHKILQCVCLQCSSLLPHKNNSCVHGMYRFRSLYDSCKKESVCEYCEFKQPKIILDQLKIYLDYQDEDKPKELISAEDTYNILRKLSDKTIEELGFHSYCIPCNMILRALPVPPPQVRPSISMDSNIKSQDDLTHKLCEIIRANNLLQKQVSTNNEAPVIQSMIELLQFHINTYIDNENAGKIQATQRTGRPIKGIFQRLKSKEGRVRGNLMGKRVDFSARTVITADANIALDELGVPHDIAVNITYPEIVTAFNKKLLQSYVNNGPAAPIGKIGAKFIELANGDKKDLRFCKNPVLQIGDKVERHMKDGDLVVFNRQPTLHKMSMMGHKVRVMNHSTFRMNLSATSPYNADFDKLLCRKQEA
tara:strand:+ start:11061 stop:12410 length:1350 start_codon:yes stop_codon:yes gene_type:complete